MNDSILIIDGQLESTQLLQSFIREEGFEPVLASTSRKAIAQAEKYSPKLILLNSYTPEFNGLEISNILKTNCETADIPIVFLADRYCNEKDEICEKYRASDFILVKKGKAELFSDIQAILKKYLPQTYSEKNINILVAEDDLVIRRTVEFLLKKNGYKNLRLCNDGKEAWEQFQQQPPELLILDYLMPYLTGFEVLLNIRKEPKYNHIPVIFLTAVDDKSKLIEALNSGATDYITKPFDQAELLARVNTQARNYYLQKQLIKSNTYLDQANKELLTKNAQIEADLRSARKIQEALLPRNEIKSDKFKISFFYQPCHSVGGDFLNYFQLDENYIGFYIADVSGHGVTSAMITVFVREQIVNIMKNYHNVFLTPGKILQQLNRIFNKEIYFLDNGMYFTIFFGMLNIHTKMLYYAAGGHHALPIIINAAGEIKELKKMDIAIGFLDDFPYQDHEIQLQSNNLLFLHTDGIIEITDKDDKFFGMERLKSFLKSNYKMNGGDFLVKLVKEGINFSDKADQEDDIALMLVEIR